MAAYGPSSLMYQIQGLQSKTLLQRCRETEDLIKRTSTKELRLVFPALLQSIFGFENEPGWGIEKLSRPHHGYDFELARSLLGPEGPVLNLVYNLQADPYTTYEFPFKLLPSPSRHTIEEGGLPVFYINKLQTHGFSMPSLALNAFELYMFHFAYALVSPGWQHAGTTWTTLYDYLYPTLVDDYLTFFLPLDGRSLPPMPHMPAAVRSPISHASVTGRQIHRSAYSPPRVTQRPSLFKRSFTLAQKQHSQSSPVLDNTEAETWRSETMLQIFVEFWLNQNSLVSDVPTFSHGTMYSSYYGQTSGPFYYLFEHFMPSLNQVKVIRLLVKHLHYFANTTKLVITSPYQHRLETPLDHFKRTVIPQIVQKKMYGFLRHAFDRWPLDCYFRMVLETWLSYIQPWRYTDVAQHYRSKNPRYREPETRERQVEEKWEQFIEDNLLFYTVLYHEFIPRIYRMDLTSPQSAYMLFRVTKVYSLPGLASMIMRAEQEVCGMSVVMSQTAELGGSYLSTSRVQPPAPTLPPQLMDMEVPGFQYMPLFAERTQYLMMDVIQRILHALGSVQATSSMATAKRQSKGWFWSLFDGDEGTETGGDHRKLPQHLENAALNLSKIFSLPAPRGLPSGGQMHEMSRHNDSTLIDEDDDMPDCEQTPDGPRLTARGRYQIVNNLRRFHNWQTGDPDLQPIRSYENAALVRLLYQLCAAINLHFGSQIWNVYNRHDFLGRLAKVCLAPPLSPGQRIQSPVNPIMAETLRQPRISLRVLASYKTLLCLGLLYAVLRVWLGTGVVGYVVLLACGLFLYGSVCALRL